MKVRLLRSSLLAAMPVLIAVLASCNRDLEPLPPTLENIFPLVEGKYRIYAVSDTDYTTVGGSFVRRDFFRRETYSGKEEDLLGRMVDKVTIDESPMNYDSSGNPIYSWGFARLWTQYNSDGFAEGTEGNIRYLYLKLPPYENAEWNGNAFNSYNPEIFKVLTLDTTVTVSGVTYSHCVMVREAYTWPPINIGGDFILRENSYQIYAPEIGKIVRHKEVFKYSGGLDTLSTVYFHEELIGHNF